MDSYLINCRKVPSCLRIWCDIKPQWAPTWFLFSWGPNIAPEEDCFARTTLLHDIRQTAQGYCMRKEAISVLAKAIWKVLCIQELHTARTSAVKDVLLLLPLWNTFLGSITLFMATVPGWNLACKIMVWGLNYYAKFQRDYLGPFEWNKSKENI